MNIIHRVINAENDFVFESPWGNKIHLRIGDPWAFRQGNRYFAEISPSLELKFEMWLMDNFESQRERDELHGQMLKWSDPNKDPLFGLILSLLNNRRTPNYPWIPCDEDRSKLVAYFNKRFGNMFRFCDRGLLEHYVNKDPGELLDERHPLIQKLRNMKLYIPMWSYDSGFKDLFEYVGAVWGNLDANDLFHRYGAFQRDRISSNVIRYLMEKAEIL